MGETVGAVSLDRVSDLGEWQARASSALYRLEMSSVGRDAFAGSLRTRRIGNVTFALTHAAPHRMLHRVTSGMTEDGRFGVSLQLEGTSIVTQDGRTRTLEPGDFCTYDALRPYTRTFEEPSRTFVVLFPRSLLRLPDRLLRDASARVMRPDGALASLSGDLLGGMSARMETFDDAAGYRVARAFVELLSASLAEGLKSEAFLRHGMADQRRLAVLDYIADHIADRDLSAGSIAAHFYVSTRHLFQIFSGRGRSLAQIIRDERLRLAESKLVDPTLRWASIAQIAEVCGYVNANYFSRVFKARYACTPSQYRDERTGASPAGAADAR